MGTEVKQMCIQDMDDCNAYEDGFCIALSDTEFIGGCPFYKPREKYLDEVKRQEGKVKFEKVESIPSRIKVKSEYKELLKEFYSSKQDIAKVTEMPNGKSPSSVSSYAANVVRELKLPIKVALRGRDVYLINTELYKGEF